MSRARFLGWFLGFMLTALAAAPALAAGQDGGSQPLDIVLVLDNSGSMRKNDPQFLTKPVVADFVRGLDANDHLGLIIFDSEARLAQPLRSRTGAAERQELLGSLNQVDYRGQLTNILAAMEKAVEELKGSGRPEAAKIIIFLTDGIVDTGNQNRDAESSRWLREYLTADAAKSDIRIFGIAFTDQADFSLIQVLAVRTGGEYYRALTAGEIEGVFSRVRTGLARLQQGVATQTTASTAVSATASTRTTLAAPAAADKAASERTGSETKPPENSKTALSSVVVIAVAALLAGGLLLIWLALRLGRRRKAGSVQEAAAPERPASEMPEALLEDMDGVTGRDRIPLVQTQFMVGRVPGTNVDLVVDRATISAIHARITFRAPCFYLEDQRSTNGTFLNGEAVLPDAPVRLKNGDVIAFDQYSFRFLTPNEPAEATRIAGQGDDPEQHTMLRPSEPAPEPGADGSWGDSGSEAATTVLAVDAGAAAMDARPQVQGGELGGTIILEPEGETPRGTVTLEPGGGVLGGTVIMEPEAGASGGTVLLEPPEAEPSGAVTADSEPPGPEIAPARPLVLAPGDGSPTLLVTGNCAKHPGEPATMICPACQQAFCGRCLPLGEVLCPDCKQTR